MVETGQITKPTRAGNGNKAGAATIGQEGRNGRTSITSMRLRTFAAQLSREELARSDQKVDNDDGAHMTSILDIEDYGLYFRLCWSKLI